MHVYPNELVSLIVEKWFNYWPGKDSQKESIDPLPETGALEELISTCYQVSMLREEDRPVTMRLILAEPSLFPAEKGPPAGFQRLLFIKPRPFNDYELRRLSPAVNFERTLIGVRYLPDRGFQIWGLINSGKRWLQNERGGSKKSNQLPGAFVVHVNGPGMLTVCHGLEIIAVLNGGKVVDSSANVFQSAWIKNLFKANRDNLLDLHEAFRTKTVGPIARIEDDFIENLQFQLLKRLISVTRMSNHGGSFLFFPNENPPELLAETPQILLKYRFQDDEALQRQQHLFLKTIQAATTALGNPKNPDQVVSWQDYVALRHELTYDLEEALYEQAQFVASLAAVDGAVVLDNNGPIGFGGMIVGSLDKLTEVAIANDTEGDLVTLEKIEGSGSRHRSVYHLCNSIHNVMAIVVSQDGNVQLAKWRNGIVTCWDLTSTTFITVS